MLRINLLAYKGLNRSELKSLCKFLLHNDKSIKCVLNSILIPILVSLLQKSYSNKNGVLVKM